MRNYSCEEYLHATIHFDHLVIALNESIQFERRLKRSVRPPKHIILSSPSKIYYGQLITHPKEEQKYDSSHRNDSRNHGEDRSRRYDDPYRYNQGYQRDR